MARSESGRRVKPSGGFELAAWFFMRISGLILVFLALGHLFITHILNNVEDDQLLLRGRPAGRTPRPGSSGGSGTWR